MTLVEVVAGIALLTVLLVMILAAFRAHAAQVRSARLRMAAIRQADALLSHWTAAEGIPAVGKQAALPELPGGSWRIAASHGSADLDEIGGSAIRLEIVSSAGLNPDSPLVSVELVVPAEGRQVP